MAQGGSSGESDCRDDSSGGVSSKGGNASTESDFEGAFANVIQLQAGGLVIGSDAFFTARSEQLAALALRYAVPTIYESRGFFAAGGLMSYGGSGPPGPSGH